MSIDGTGLPDAPAAPDLAARVGAVVQEHPGVRIVYSARPPVADALAAVAQAVVPVLDSGGPIVVQAGAGGTTVRVSIGVFDDGSSSRTCRELYEEIVAVLDAESAERPYDIAVKVASIG